MRPRTHSAGATGRPHAFRRCAIVLGIACLAFAPTVEAACDVIPSAIHPFRAAVGSVDRPFATPGDWLEFSPNSCTPATLFPSRVDDVAVTMLFSPPGDDSVPVALVLTPDDCATATAACQAALPPGSPGVACRTLQTRGAVVDIERPRNRRKNLRLRFPDTDDLVAAPGDDLTLTGPALIAVTGRGRTGLAEGVSIACGLRTPPRRGCTTEPGLLACVDRLFADGTCAPEPDVQFTAFTALPPPTDYAALCTEPSVVEGGPCLGTAARTVFVTLDAAGNVLIPVDWTGVLLRDHTVPVARLLSADSMLAAFAGLPETVRIPAPEFLESFSPEGRKLPPLFEAQTDASDADVLRLFGSADAPRTVLRLDRRAVTGRCERGERPCIRNGDCRSGERCVRYHACADGRVPCTGGADGDLECTRADAGVPCMPTTCAVCVAGPRQGLPCRSPADCGEEAEVGPAIACVAGTDACFDDGDCPDVRPGVSGQCGPSLFDFASRFDPGGGPIEISDVDAKALDPVPLTGLVQHDEGDTVNVLVMDERVAAPAGSDLNGDGDATDPVLMLQDRATGDVQPIGALTVEGRARARAVTLLEQGGFRFPSAAIAGDVVGFLEPELYQGGLDLNGNGQVFESVLRVFRQATDSSPLTDALAENGTAVPLTADAAPVIDGRPLVVMPGGRVVFRTNEADLVPYEVDETMSEAMITGPSPNGESTHPAVSGAGRFVAFASAADNLVPDDTNGAADVFVYDRATAETTRVSVAYDGAEASARFGLNLGSFSPSISADGELVVFVSEADNLVPDDTNNSADVFVHDRVTGETVRASVASDRTQGNGFVQSPVLSDDGTTVVFASDATNLVSGDTNGATDVFVHDLLTGETERVSVGADEIQGNDASLLADLSADGTIVVFASRATNLVPNQSGGGIQVFVRDLVARTTEAVSVRPGGGVGDDDSFGPVISADGRLVAFQSDATNLVVGDTNGDTDVFVRDRFSHETSRVSVASDAGEKENADPNWDPTNPPRIAMSADGRFVAFGSYAADLVLDDTNGRYDVFVHDRLDGHTTRASVDSQGFQGDLDAARFSALGFSGAGRFLAFASDARLVPEDAIEGIDVFVRDLELATTERVSTTSLSLPASSLDAALSADGEVVAFASDANSLSQDDVNVSSDVFAYDRRTGHTTLVSVSLAGISGRGGSYAPAASADGRLVAFASDADDLVQGDTNRTRDVFVRDLASGVTTRASVASDGTQANAPSSFDHRPPFRLTPAIPPALSVDGRFVAFASEATNLVPDDTNGSTDVFVHDRLTGVTTRASVSSKGRQANGSSCYDTPPALSADGRFVAFDSDAENLVPGDKNDAVDVFVHDRLTGETARVSVASGGSPSFDFSLSPTLSGDGRFAAFWSYASNLVPGDTNGRPDVFVHDRLTGETTRASVGSDGRQASDPENVFFYAGFGLPRLALSSDGRFVAFQNAATSFLSEASPLLEFASGAIATFLRDRLTGQTLRVAEEGNAASKALSLSADARVIAFEQGDTFRPYVVVRGPIPGGDGDLSEDGDSADTLLRVFVPDDPRPVELGPATVAATASDVVAFLRPEWNGAPGLSAGVDLNGDGDTTDAVVQLAHFEAGGVPRLEPACPAALGAEPCRSATAVALSDEYVVALMTPPAAVGDTTVAVRPTGGDSWHDLGHAADTVAVRENLVAFLTPRTPPAEVGEPRHVLQIYDAAAGRFLLGGDSARPPAPAWDFVLGPSGSDLIAFRTNEASVGLDLDDDGDKRDDVLQVFDAAAGSILNTRQAVRPCRFEACDPREPYRVDNDSVTFLSFEGDVRRDLNADGDDDDLIVQTVAVRALVARAVAASDAPLILQVLGAVPAGVCTTTARACFLSEECGNGTCFVPPGGCLRRLAAACAPGSSVSSCPGESFCEPRLDAPQQGTCVEVLTPSCAQDADCRDPAAGGDPAAFCSRSGPRMQRLIGPLTRAASRRSRGPKVFTGAGRCLETVRQPDGVPITCQPTAVDPRGGCRRGAVCEALPDSGTLACQRQGRVCTVDADCPGGGRCKLELITATAHDRDGDEVPDAFDNCLVVPNPSQVDDDANGVGNECDSPCPEDTTLGSLQCRTSRLIDATIRAGVDARMVDVLRHYLDIVYENIGRLEAPGRTGRRACRRVQRELRRYSHRLRLRRMQQLVPEQVRLLLIDSAGRLSDDVRLSCDGG